MSEQRSLDFGLEEALRWVRWCKRIVAERRSCLCNVQEASEGLLTMYEEYVMLSRGGPPLHGRELEGRQVTAVAEHGRLVFDSEE